MLLAHHFGTSLGARYDHTILAVYFRPTSIFASAALLTGCGLALNLDDYSVVETDDISTSGDSDGSTSSGTTDVSSTGDGDTTGDSSSGAETTTSTDGDGDSTSGGDSTGGAGSGPDGTAGETSVVMGDCSDTETGNGKDEGCSSAAPICSDGTCVACVVDDDCAEDGHDCSEEICDAGTCIVAYHHSECSGYGDPCLDTTCGEDGCSVEDISYEVDLLDGQGDFENDDFWTVEDSADLDTPSRGTAHGGDQVAQLTTWGNQKGNVYARVDVPAGTQWVEVKGFYRSIGSGDNHKNDFLRVGFYDPKTTVWYAKILDTKGDADQAVAPDWTEFKARVVADEFDDFLADEDHPGTVEFDLYGQATFVNFQEPPRHFVADDITITAKICEP